MQLIKSPCTCNMKLIFVLKKKNYWKRYLYAVQYLNFMSYRFIFDDQVVRIWDIMKCEAEKQNKTPTDFRIWWARNCTEMKVKIKIRKTKRIFWQELQAWTSSTKFSVFRPRKHQNIGTKATTFQFSRNFLNTHELEHTRALKATCWIFDVLFSFSLPIEIVYGPKYYWFLRE